MSIEEQLNLRLQKVYGPLQSSLFCFWSFFFSFVRGATMDVWDAMSKVGLEIQSVSSYENYNIPQIKIWVARE